jgi:hypothetical protein
MEPSDFDDIIKGKFEQDNDLYSNEIEHSKPYVWTAIQQNLIADKAPIRWHHLAVAVILLFICTSFVIYLIQQQHHKEMNQLAKSMNVMNSNYLAQSKQLQQKEEQLKCLEVDIQSLKQDNKFNSKKDLIVSEPHYVYLTDTIYVKQIKYITQIENRDTLDASLANNDTIIDKESIKPNQMIYPVYKTSKSIKEESENLKVKINSFASNQ